MYSFVIVIIVTVVLCGGAKLQATTRVPGGGWGNDLQI